MDNKDTIWLNLPKYSDEYIAGVKAFISNAFLNFAIGNEMRCRCKKCNNHRWHPENIIYDHLICSGPSPTYVKWIYEVSCSNLKDGNNNMEHDMDIDFGDDFNELLHATFGKGQNADTRKFYHLLEEGKQPLYPGCKKFSRLSFLVRLYLLKCTHGITDSAFGDILELIKEAFPDVNVPSSFNDAKNVIKDLGLHYQTIHACPNDCMLYWGEDESEDACQICGSSRWRPAEKKLIDETNNEKSTS